MENHLIMKVGQLIDTIISNIFGYNLHFLHEYCALNLDPFMYCNNSKINFDKFVIFCSFEDVHLGHQK